MNETTDNFSWDSHEYYGGKLKLAQTILEQLRADLVHTYEKSASKDARQIQQVMDKIRLIQVSMHSRLIAEYSEKPDIELLPTYLGR
jgi:hypothetical protein